MPKAAYHFNVNYRSNLRDLAKKKSIKRINPACRTLSKPLRWFYKNKINNEPLVLINNNQPTFNARYIAFK